MAEVAIGIVVWWAFVTGAFVLWGSYTLGLWVLTQWLGRKTTNASRREFLRWAWGRRKTGLSLAEDSEATDA